MNPWELFPLYFFVTNDYTHPCPPHIIKPDLTMQQLLRLSVLALLCLVNSAQLQSQTLERTPAPTAKPTKIKLAAPSLALTNVGFDLHIKALREDDTPDPHYAGDVNLEGVSIRNKAGGFEPVTSVRLINGAAVVSNVVVQSSGKHAFSANSNGAVSQADVRVIPGILSLLPPLLAITLAFLTREVLISLFAGIWLGALFIFNYNPFVGLIRTVDKYLINALADSNNASILVFSMTLGAMVGVISKAGGTQGIVQKLAKYAKNPRGGQLATWAMGILIFFDDYANSLIVGNTMRPFTDRLKISREKLSYIVDSTAAPVASIALISTWIGYQVGLIDQVAQNLGLQQNAYQMFLASIPYSTYSILALLFVGIIAWTSRDFGPMRAAENRALNTGKVLRDGAQPLTDSATLDMVADEDTPLRWYNALTPIIVVILTTLIGLYVDGRASLGEAAETARLGTIFGSANSFAVLLWASFIGLLTACGLAMAQRILNLKQTVAATVNGYKSMLLACMILVLAWSIGNICKDLNTAGYVIDMTRDILSPRLIPFATFVLAGFIAFSTGTSWATMAILTPIVLPIAFHLPADAGLSEPASYQIFIATIGAVLSGSVLGDHCSPISDTTILSSMASAADHVDHVRTQLPYAIVVGVVASLTGYIPSGWGVRPIISLAIGTLVLLGIVRFFGKKPEVTSVGQEQATEAVRA